MFPSDYTGHIMTKVGRDSFILMEFEYGSLEDYSHIKARTYDSAEVKARKILSNGDIDLEIDEDGELSEKVDEIIFYGGLEIDEEPMDDEERDDWESYAEYCADPSHGAD